MSRKQLQEQPAGGMGGSQGWRSRKAPSGGKGTARGAIAGGQGLAGGVDGVCWCGQGPSTGM